jgi:sRNA-binding carbon storage regulator CsrA
VYRKEVYEMIQEANREASESASIAVEMEQLLGRKKDGGRNDQ